MKIEVKVGPEVGPNADELTSLTRGRGPRRGNLEDLLKYWRPIMKKPGGFRRCVVILADKPQFAGQPQRICAWLHHETTGKWPNEGKGKRGKGGSKRRGRSVSRTVRRAARRSKSFDGSSNSVKVSALRLAVRESRESNGLLTQPINNRQNVIDYKASLFNKFSNEIEVSAKTVEDTTLLEVKRVGLFGSSSRAGQAVQAAGSIAIPGDLSDIRSPVRSAVFEALTPGIPSRPGTGAIRRALRGAGRGARNKFRCPPGFEKGGTFTNSEFSTCGAQVLRIPNLGPGSFAPNVQRQLARLSRSADLVRSIGDLRRNRNSIDIIRAAQIPTAPKKTNPTMVNTSLDYIRQALSRGEEFGDRFVRRDGVILEPSLSMSAIGRLDQFDDMVDGSFVVTNPTGTFGADEIPMFRTGMREVVYNIPEVGTVTLRKVGGDLSDEEKLELQDQIRAAAAESQGLPDPTALIRSFAENSDGRFEIEFGTVEGTEYTAADDALNERITVSSGQGTIIVLRWVYETYLSRTAPRRAPNDPVFEIIEEEGGSKSLNPFYLSDESRKAGKTTKYYSTVDAKAQRFTQTKAATLYDADMRQYRCPPGTRNGGSFTDSGGTTCGGSLSDFVVSALSKLAERVSEIKNRASSSGKKLIDRPGLSEEGKSRIKEDLELAEFISDQLDDALANLPETTVSDLGPTISQMQLAQVLTVDERGYVKGSPISKYLDELQSSVQAIIDDPDNLPSPEDIEVLQNALFAIANANAARKSFIIEDYGLQEIIDGTIESKIEVISDLIYALTFPNPKARLASMRTQRREPSQDSIDQDIDGIDEDILDFDDIEIDIEELAQLEAQEALDRLSTSAHIPLAIPLEKFDGISATRTVKQKQVVEAERLVRRLYPDGESPWRLEEDSLFDMDDDDLTMWLESAMMVDRDIELDSIEVVDDPLHPEPHIVKLIATPRTAVPWEITKGGESFERGMKSNTYFFMGEIDLSLYREYEDGRRELISSRSNTSEFMRSARSGFSTYSKTFEIFEDGSMEVKDESVKLKTIQVFSEGIPDEDNIDFDRESAYLARVATRLNAGKNVDPLYDDRVDAAGYGLADTLNLHAMTFYGEAGKKADRPVDIILDAAWDGPAVWPRRGFRPKEDIGIKNPTGSDDATLQKLTAINERMGSLVDAFDRNDDSPESIVARLILKDERRRNLVANLFNRYVDSNDVPEAMPSHGDFLMALDGPNGERNNFAFNFFRGISITGPNNYANIDGIREDLKSEGFSDDEAQHIAEVVVGKTLPDTPIAESIKSLGLLNDDERFYSGVLTVDHIDPDAMDRPSGRTKRSTTATKGTARELRSNLAANGQLTSTVEVFPEIRNKQEAQDSLQNGVSLSEIPDAFLFDAISEMADSDQYDRFETLRVSQGQNTVKIIRDNTTNQVYGLKGINGLANPEEVPNELFGNEIVNAMQWDTGAIRASVNSDGSPALVIQFADGLYDDWEVAGSKDTVALADERNALRIMVLDLIMDNDDRHADNLGITRRNLYPIDHGSSFSPRYNPDAAPEDSFSGKRLAGYAYGYSGLVDLIRDAYDSRDYTESSLEDIQSLLQSINTDRLRQRAQQILELSRQSLGENNYNRLLKSYNLAIEKIEYIASMDNYELSQLSQTIYSTFHGVK